mgnify:CR=1 FL=1
MFYIYEKSSTYIMGKMNKRTGEVRPDHRQYYKTMPAAKAALTKMSKRYRADLLETVNDPMFRFGIAEAGWGGFAIAAVLMAIMYLTLVLSLAEMSAAIPAAGGGYSFARQAMGPTGGYLTGLAVLIEYALAPAAIVIFIGSAVEALTGFNGPWVYALFYLVFVGIHLAGVGEALKVMMVISGLAVLAIIATAVVLVANFDASKLYDVAVTDAAGASELLPLGWYGVWAALPFAMWLFLAVEGVPLAAEEAKNPAKDVPKGIIGAMIFLLFTALLVVVLVPGVGGAAA